MARSTVVYSSPMPGGSLAEVVARATAAKAAGSKKKGGAPAIDVAGVLERLTAANALREQAVSGKELSEEVVMAAEAITSDQGRRKADIVALTAAMKSGSLLPETGNEYVAVLSAEVEEWSGHLRVLTSEHPSLATEIARRANRRGRVAELTAKLNRFELGTTGREDVAELASEAAVSGVLKRLPGPPAPIVIGYGREVVFYGPADDPESVQFASGFSAFMARFDERGREIRDAKRNDVADFLLSREQVQPLKDLESTTRDLSGFFGGNGQYCFVPAVSNDLRTGQERFDGEILLERRNGDPFATHATNVGLARRVFGWYDRQAETWKRHGIQKIVALKGKDEWNLDGVRNNALREALKAKLVKDATFQATRDAARQLRNVDLVEGPVITMAEILRDDEQGTAVVNVRLNAGQERSVWATMHVVSDGSRAHIAAYAPDDLPEVVYYEKRAAGGKRDAAPEKVYWLKPFLTPQGLDMWRQDPNWQRIVSWNQDFESTGLLSREAKKLGAAVLAAENVDGLCSVEKGADGLYAVTKATTGGYGPRHPLRLIVERKGNEVAVAWASPGESWRWAHDKAGESVIGEYFPVADMPPALQALLRNQYRYFRGLGGPSGLEQVPDHLKIPAGAASAGDEEVGAGDSSDEEKDK